MNPASAAAAIARQIMTPASDQLYLAGPDEPVDQADQPGGQQREPGPVGRRGVRRLRFLDPPGGQCDGEDADRHVDQEDAAPAPVGGDHAAEDRTERRRHAGDRPPDPERHAAIAAAEALPEQRQRRGEHDRPADALAAPGHDQHHRVLGHAAQQRAQGEDDQADLEQQLPAIPVGEHARGQQQRGEGQGVGVEHPLHVGEAGMQPVLDGGLGHHDDRDVEQQHEHPRADRDQGPPLLIHKDHAARSSSAAANSG